MTQVTEVTQHQTVVTGRSKHCPACHNAAVRVFHDVNNVPTNSCILLGSVEEAQSYPTGNIALGLCEACGFIFNTVFDRTKTEYSGRYEETQGFSNTFNSFHKALAERLVERYDLHGKTIMEIGCGKGEFLMLLAELGKNQGIGIDPGVRIDRISGPGADRLKFIPDFYSEKYADQKIDFLACKMTLEHIPDAERFVSLIRQGLDDQVNTVVFFQIPEAMRILRECAFEDIYYEHCSYFTPGSLARLFRRLGFDVIRLEVEYDGQYLTIEAKPRTSGRSTNASFPLEEDLQTVINSVETFPDRCRKKLKGWRSKLLDAQNKGQKVVLWGSGSKAVSFLTTLGVGKAVTCVTDVNPYRHNHFMPHTGHRIVAPEELKNHDPDIVVVMNAIYEDEIRRDLFAMGLSPCLISL